MSESNNTPDEFIAEAEVTRRKSVSIVWLIPVVALVIGGWLAYKAYTERGPVITIAFEQGAGIIAGKTKVRFRDVDVGSVESISLSDDINHVLVEVEMVKESEAYLRDGTRFWIEQPRITATEVRGLQTVLSGVYIGIDPSKEGKPTREFTGMEEAPFVTGADEGSFYTLQAPRRGSVSEGSPVFYRDIDVGEVVKYDMLPDGSHVEIRVFVKAPFDQLVTTNTRFWSASGLDVELSADGLRVNTESLVSLLIGGIAFGVPEGESPGADAPDDASFVLHDDRETAFQRVYTKLRTLVYFNESVRGLTVGAPVEFRGIHLGKVLDVRLEFVADEYAFRIPVLVEIEPERFEIVGAPASEVRPPRPGEASAEEILAERMADLQRLVDQGMRAQLKTGNLLTGARFVDLDIYPDAEPAVVRAEGGHPVMPTTPTALEAITTKLTGILDKLAALPLEEIGEDLSGTLQEVRTLVQETDLKPALDALTSALQQAEEFSRKMNTELSPQIEATLRELNGAARSIRVMTDYLERHPDALIRGKDSGR